MRHLISTDVTQARVAKWITEAKPVEDSPTWIEYRQAIVVGEHTFLISNGQVFQCGHCGHYDPEWKAHEVLEWFKNVMGIKPTEIAVTCSVAVKE